MTASTRTRATGTENNSPWSRTSWLTLAHMLVLHLHALVLVLVPTPHHEYRLRATYPLPWPRRRHSCAQLNKLLLWSPRSLTVPNIFRPRLFAVFPSLTAIIVDAGLAKEWRYTRPLATVVEAEDEYIRGPKAGDTSKAASSTRSAVIGCSSPYYSALEHTGQLLGYR